LDIVTATGTVSVLLGQGNGSFGAARTYAIGGPANSVALGDFNHNGRLDIATTGSTETDVLQNNGTFGAYQKVGPAGCSVLATDFNGDGYADLGSVAASSNSTDLLLNRPTGSRGTGPSASATASDPPQRTGRPTVGRSMRTRSSAWTAHGGPPVNADRGPPLTTNSSVPAASFDPVPDAGRAAAFTPDPNPSGFTEGSSSGGTGEGDPARLLDRARANEPVGEQSGL
jgi:hypothetical protein